MSNNMTRKGLALGAGFALVATSFAAAVPAQAAEVISGSVDLTPATGPSDGFATFAENGKTLDLTLSSIVAGSSHKVLVNDPAGKVEPELVVGTTNYDTRVSILAEDANFTLSVTTKKLTIKAANTFTAGDKIFFSADIENAAATGAADALTIGTVIAQDDTVFTVDSATATEFTLEEDVENVIDTGEFVQIDDASAVKLVRTARSGGSYVVDTGVETAGLTPVNLVLNDTSGDTVTATVQAFSDADGDNKIAANALNEYASPVRTLNWLDPEADLTLNTVLNAPVPGAQTLSATVTTEPVLNGAQLGEATAIKITYTRQGSDEIGVTGNATQDADGEWTATALPLNVIDGDNADDVDFYTVATGAIATGDGADWGLERAVAGTGATTVVKDDVATTTKTAHKLRVGDKVKFTDADGDDDAALSDKTFEVTSVPTANTFTFAVTRDDTTAAIAQAYTVVTLADGNKSLVDGVFAGTYSARGVVLVDYDDNADEWAYAGVADTRGTFTASVEDVVVSTTASETVQGVEYNTDAANKVLVLEETNLTVPVTATLLDDEGDPVGAGRSVLLRINSASAGVEVNGSDSNTTLYSDSNGQVTFDVISTTGADGVAADIDLQPEGDNTYTTRLIVEWEDRDYSMTDMTMTGSGISTPRVITAGSSYDLNIRVMDEWFQAAPSEDYRIKVSGSGVTEGFVNLVDGEATVTVTDNGLSTTSFTSTVTLQKLGTTGVFADVAGSAVNVVNNIAPSNPDLVLGADGDNLYGAVTDLSTAVSEAALVERDNRLTLTQAPDYVNNAVVTGRAFNGTTAAALAGSVVTISGPNNILFEEGNVASRGSLTFLADGSGEFDVKLYSTTSQEDTEITVTANGVSKTVDVTFTGKGIGEATELTLTAPSNVQPSSTFQVTGSLKDDFGNGVAAAAIEVTYLGPGITFGDLPTTTDANGNFRFSVLLGANDTDDISVTVSYDQNADGDYTDDKDLVEASTIKIGGSATQKVNAGSFKGYVAVYALGYEGQRLSAKIGNDWVIVDPIVNNESANLARVTDFTGAGVDIQVRIYIDRVLVDTIPLTTK